MQCSGKISRVKKKETRALVLVFLGSRSFPSHAHLLHTLCVHTQSGLLYPRLQTCAKALHVPVSSIFPMIKCCLRYLLQQDNECLTQCPSARRVRHGERGTPPSRSPWQASRLPDSLCYEAFSLLRQHKTKARGPPKSRELFQMETGIIKISLKDLKEGRGKCSFINYKPLSITYTYAIYFYINAGHRRTGPGWLLFSHDILQHRQKPIKPSSNNFFPSVTCAQGRECQC